MGGTCSAANDCYIGDYCQNSTETDKYCINCKPTQPLGAVCNCGENSKVENCASCKDGACSACANSFYLAEQKCLKCGENCQKCDATACSACLDGYFLEGNVCKKCGECLTCSSLSTCLSCKPGQFLAVSGKCDSCPENCISCTKAGVCDVCDVNSYVSSDGCETCQIDQPAGVKCNCGDGMRINCVSCKNDVCVACNTGFSLVGPYCYTDECNKDENCNTGQLCDIRPGFLQKCKLCVDNCKSCTISSTQCTECGENMYLNVDRCDTCNLEQPEGAQCVCGDSIVQNCINCVEGICMECSTGNNLIHGKCQNIKEQQDQKTMIIGVSVGVVLTIVLIICVLVGGLFIIKRKKSQKMKNLKDNGVLLPNNDSGQQMVF